MQRLLLAALAALTLLALPAVAGAADTDQLDRVLERARARTQAPGATAAIVHDGRVVWSGASGLATDPAAAPMRPGDRAPGAAVPMRDDTLLSLASVTKSYTAAIVLRLAEQRRLRLDDRVARFLPRVPAARRVTVRELLDHTSGYPDVEYDPRFTRYTHDRATYDPSRPWTRAGMIALTRAPAFRPGSRFAYSNTNYLLLGSIAERAGRAPLPVLLERFVTGRLGLRDTLLTRSALPLERVSHGHYRFGGRALLDTWSGRREAPSNLFGPAWPDGGVAATAADVARFFDAFHRGQVVRPATVRTMTRVRSAAVPYGLGIERYRFGGRNWTGHSGGDGGYTSLALTDRARGVTIVVLSNQFEVEADGRTPSPGSSAGTIWLALRKAYDAGGR
jgi:D-alanyl-D-alanine carboxypeptidase